MAKHTTGSIFTQAPIRHKQKSPRPSLIPVATFSQVTVQLEYKPAQSPSRLNINVADHLITKLAKANRTIEAQSREISLLKKLIEEQEECIALDEDLIGRLHEDIRNLQVARMIKSQKMQQMARENQVLVEATVRRDEKIKQLATENEELICAMDHTKDKEVALWDEIGRLETENEELRCSMDSMDKEIAPLWEEIERLETENQELKCAMTSHDKEVTFWKSKFFNHKLPRMDMDETFIPSMLV